MALPAWTLGSRTGPIRKHKDLAYFACEGLIAIIDERPQYTGDPPTIQTPSQFAERVRALKKFVKKETKTPELTAWERQELKQLTNDIQGMEDAIKEAREMGDPSDPKVQEFWARQRRNSVVSMSGTRWEHGKPKQTLQEMAADALGGRQLNPDADIPTIHVSPRRKNKSKLILDL